MTTSGGAGHFGLPELIYSAVSGFSTVCEVPLADGTHTFLFMDLVGFTALTAERGDDSAAEVALRLFASVRRLLPEHRGEEIKTIGDAMMIRCDDPRQGV